MKKILGLLGSFGLIASTTTSVVSCGGLGNLKGIFSKRCYDENWFDVTDEDSNQKQWDYIFGFTFLMELILKEDIPDSDAFLKLDHQDCDNLAILLKNSLERILNEINKDQEEIKVFPSLASESYTLLITNYNSINAKVIKQMKKDLDKEDPGTYLFLNLPSINLQEIQYELEIDFQYLFLTKDNSGSISNNENNEWFYWYQNDCRNSLFPDPDKEGEYFFNLLSYANTKRVVRFPTPQK